MINLNKGCNLSKLFAFILRHFIASIASIVFPILLVIITYFVLLLIAIIGNMSLGGILALPFWIIVAGIVSLLYTTCLLFPAVFLAELITQRYQLHPILVQIPISVTMLVALVYILAYGFRQLFSDANTQLYHFANCPLYIFLFLCFPLGLYWWTAKIVQMTGRGFIALYKNLT